MFSNFNWGEQYPDPSDPFLDPDDHFFLDPLHFRGDRDGDRHSAHELRHHADPDGGRPQDAEPPRNEVEASAVPFFPPPGMMDGYQPMEGGFRPNDWSSFDFEQQQQQNGVASRREERRQRHERERQARVSRHRQHLLQLRAMREAERRLNEGEIGLLPPMDLNDPGPIVALSEATASQQPIPGNRAPSASVTTAKEKSQEDERKCKENMSFFASNVIKVAASCQHPADGAAIDNVLLEVCKRALSEKPNSECSGCENEKRSESLKRCHDSDKEENQECLESVCNSSPTLMPNRKVVKHNLGEKAFDVSADASMALSEEQKRTLENKGITGEWLARFRVIYNTMARLQANGSESSAAISALSTQAQELAQGSENSDEKERKRRRSSSRRMDPSVCSLCKKRRE